MKYLLMWCSCMAFLPYCRGQLKQADAAACKLSYKRGARVMNDFYTNKDSSHLAVVALPAVDSAMGCPQTRPAAIILKCSILMLLKKYDQGHAFVDSLGEQDFARSYQKELYSKSFLALSYESRSDTIIRNRLHHEIIARIEKYIQDEAGMYNSKFDEMAFYELFFIKSRADDRNQVSADIDVYRVRYPAGKDFFEDVEQALYSSEAHGDTKVGP